MKNTEKHTQGIWNYNEHTNVIWSDIEIEGNNPVVCTLRQHYQSYDSMLKNGQLIAAAPDLLEALQAMQERYLYNKREELTPEALQVYDLVKNAIDKAIK